MSTPDHLVLRRAIGEAHRRYTRYMNFQKGWKGHLWQGRFASFPMDEQYLIATVRYIVMHPVRARLVKKAEEYKWSSAKAHLQGKDDILVKVAPLAERIRSWREFLQTEIDEMEHNAIRQHERTGRPLGSEDFVSRLESITDRVLIKQKPGPKKRN